MSIAYIHCQFLGPRVIPAKAGIQETSAWGLDARLRGHDVLLVPDLRNGHLARMVAPSGSAPAATYPLEKKIYPNGCNPAIIAPTRRAWHVHRHGICNLLRDLTASPAYCVDSHSTMQVSRVGLTCAHPGARETGVSPVLPRNCERGTNAAYATGWSGKARPVG